jgi:hypothetical protein
MGGRIQPTFWSAIRDSYALQREGSAPQAVSLKNKVECYESICAQVIRTIPLVENENRSFPARGIAVCKTSSGIVLNFWLNLFFHGISKKVLANNRRF